MNNNHVCFLIEFLNYNNIYFCCCRIC